jgi:multidrug efflux pump subunit AcrA (membrane-fusion protein)
MHHAKSVCYQDWNIGGVAFSKADKNCTNLLANALICLTWFLVTCFFFTVSIARTNDSKPTKESKNDSLIVFEGKLFCPLSRPVIMPFPGIFTDIRITPGQLVKKGETVGQYNLDDGRAIELGREILFTELDDLKGNIETTKQKIITLEQNEQELLHLTAENLSPKNLLDSQQTELRLTRAYLSVLDKQFANAQVFANRTLNHMRELLGDSTIESGQIPAIVILKAPISGVILSLHPQLRKNSLLPEGTIISQIGTMDTMLIRSLVYERDVVHLAPGTNVSFFPDSLPGRYFPATVTAIDRTPATTSSDLPSYYQVEMTIENNDLELREGFKGRVESRQLDK